MEYGYTEEAPSMDNYRLAEGYDAICILTHAINSELMDAFKSVGVKMIGTRSNGYDHIDVAHAKETGMIVTNVVYDPIGVAEYTVLLMLMVVRNIKKIEARNVANDFRLNGMLGRSLGELKVGIVGAGTIGLRVLRMLSGFGCETYYYNRSPSPAADKLAHRLEFDELLETCDIVSIHIELNGETYHKFNSSAFEKMKEDAILINTSRGAVVDTEALIEALESGSIGGAGIDVVEDEFSFYYYDCSGTEISNPYMDRLRAMDNVVFTHHMAFYCDASVRGMAVCSMESIKAMGEGKDIPHRLARIGTGSSERSVAGSSRAARPPRNPCPWLCCAGTRRSCPMRLSSLSSRNRRRSAIPFRTSSAPRPSGRPRG